MRFRGERGKSAFGWRLVRNGNEVLKLVLGQGIALAIAGAAVGIGVALGVDAVLGLDAL